MTLFLVRHGESTHNVSLRSEINPQLTSLGIWQSHCTSDQLIYYLLESQPKNVHVFISPYLRTQKTSEPFIHSLTKLRNKFQKIDAHLTNHVIEFLPKHKTIPPDLISLGVQHDENWLSFLNRVQLFNQRIKDLLNNETIVIVFSHRLFISALLTHQIIQEQVHGCNKLAICSLIDNCSISCVNYLNKSKDCIWSVDSIGDVRHLYQ